ncbi:MAG: acyltransferase family protein, partial [Nitrososphaerales archaeon]
MATLYHPGADPTRVYFGTDTRMLDLLIGAAVAMLVAARPQPSRRVRRALHWAAPIAAAALGVAWVDGGTHGGMPQGWMFEGGFLACALAAAVVVVDASQHRLGPLGKLLAVAPLRWIGTISYGLYLWHWPVLVYVDHQTTGLDGAPLDLVRVAIALAAATASYYLVERPIRRARFTGVPRFAAAPVAAVVTAAAVVVATVPAVVVAPSPVSAEVRAISASVVPGGPVPGAGVLPERPLVAVPSFGPLDPLRVTVVGDSVAKGAEPAIAAALDSTGEVRVANATIDGFGLSTDPGWRTSLPNAVSSRRAQIVLATWSWDDECSPHSPTPFARRSGVCAL